MSREYTLIVSTVDPTSEISIYDASLNRVGRGVGRYQGRHADALYEVRVRTAGSRVEKLISLADDKIVEMGEVAFSSSAPLAQTAASDEYYQQAVVRASREPQALGQGSGLLLAVRGSSRSDRSANDCDPAAGLTLIDLYGSVVCDIGQQASVERAGRYAAAAICLDLDPGVYRLRQNRPDAPARERTLVASPNWTTQCFLQRRTRQDLESVDLALGSLSLARLGQPFEPQDKRARLHEAAREALLNNRKVTDVILRELIEIKFEDPMLGLFAGHLLLRDSADSDEKAAATASSLPDVVAHLVRLLGSAHPDVVALRAAMSGLPSPELIQYMPMLRASWDLIVDSSDSSDASSLPPFLSPALEQPAAHVLPGAPWLIWEADDGPAPQQPSKSKLAALRNYLAHSSNLPYQSGLESTARSIGLESYVSSSAASLEPAERKDLMRSLGVTRTAFDALLSKVSKLDWEI